MMIRAKRGPFVAPMALVAACSAVTGLSDYSICEENCGDAAADVGGDSAITTNPTDATSSGALDVSTDVRVDADATADSALETGCTNCDSGADAPVSLRSSCKQLLDLDGVTTDGVHPLAGGKNVYCNMTLAGGGWTLIASTPPAPKGFWEENAQTLTTTTFLTNPGANGMMLPNTVDGQGLGYTEVLFLDTGLGNWFIVDSGSDFYRHNYQGSCGDNLVLNNKLFGVKSRSNGGGSLYAWWANGCANGADTITQKNQSCGDVFVNFDQSCAGAGTRIQAFVR